MLPSLLPATGVLKKLKLQAAVHFCLSVLSASSQVANLCLDQYDSQMVSAVNLPKQSFANIDLPVAQSTYPMIYISLRNQFFRHRLEA